MFLFLHEDNPFKPLYYHISEGIQYHGYSLFKIPQKIKNLSLSPKEKEIIEILKNGGLTISEIKEKSDLEINKLLSIITHLEIKGIIFNQGGKFYLSK